MTPINYDKYKGHMGPWTRNSNNQVFDAEGEGVAEVAIFPYSTAKSHLITDAPLILQRCIELEEALSRQCDNMAFVVNHIDLKAWGQKFQFELELDRQALSRAEEGE